MANVMDILPEVPASEQVAISGIVNEVSEANAQNFAMAYRAQRKDETTVLILTILGFAIVAGLQRFFLGQIGMGILYLLTAGLCLIGTIIDAVNHKKLTTEYNVRKANEISMRLGSRSSFTTLR